MRQLSRATSRGSAAEAGEVPMGGARLVTVSPEVRPLGGVAIDWVAVGVGPGDVDVECGAAA